MSVARGVFYFVVLSVVQLAAADIGGEIAAVLDDKETLQSPSPESLYGNNYGGGRDTYTETSHTSVFGEIGKAFKDAMIGFVLFLLGFPVLFFNEFRQAKMSELFDRAKGILYSNVPSDKVDPALDRCLVHVQGETANAEEIRDPQFSLSVANCVKLERKVQMFLWTEQKSEETRDTNSGGTETKTTYSYEQQWCSSYVDSSSFKERDGHENPSKMEISSEDWVGPVVTLGAFTLPSCLKNRLTNSQDCTDEAAEVINNCEARRKLQMEFSNVDGWFSTQKGAPNIGDYRVSFSKVPCGPTTVVGVQKDSTFTELHFKHKVDTKTGKVDLGSGPAEPLLEEGRPAQHRMGVEMPQEQDSSNPCSCCPCCCCCGVVGALIESGESVHEIEAGTVSAVDMLTHASDKQSCIHKVLMFVGWLMMVIGIHMMLAVVPALFRIIPFIGTYVQAFGNAIVTVISLVFGSIFALITIAVGWLTIRPFKAAALIAVSLVIFFLPNILDAAGVRIGQ